MPEITLQWQQHDQTHSYTVRATDRVTIGRGDTCTVVLPQPTVSRQHALIFAEGETFYVRNLSQTNSVRVNNEQRLTFDQTAPLQPGDVFQLGPVTFQVGSREEAQPLKMRCSNCGRVTDYTPHAYCPWCGMSLAGAETLIGIE